MFPIQMPDKGIKNSGKETTATAMSTKNPFVVRVRGSTGVVLSLNDRQKNI